MPPRIVLDTNVLISRMFWPLSIPAQAVRCAAAHYEVIASEHTADELSGTIQKPKFERYGPLDERERLFAELLSTLTIVPVTEAVTDCRHPPDNKFLALAASGKAEVIVTGDKDLLVLHPWRSVAILTPQQFLAMHQAVGPTTEMM